MLRDGLCNCVVVLTRTGRGNVAFLGHNSMLKDNLHGTILACTALIRVTDEIWDTSYISWCMCDLLHAGWLLEAAPFGLSIYGGNWHDAITELLPHVRGTLPLEDIAELYSSVKIVLGTTGQSEN